MDRKKNMKSKIIMMLFIKLKYNFFIWSLKKEKKNIISLRSLMIINIKSKHVIVNKRPIHNGHPSNIKKLSISLNIYVEGSWITGW